MIENRSDFNEYPHRVFASVILVDGKIVSWRTGNTRWTKDNYSSSNQPLIVYRNKITIRSRSFMVKNREQHNNAFEILTKRFYRQFDLHKWYSSNMAKPY